MKNNESKEIILIVDDNELNLEILKLILQDDFKDFKIITTNNGYDALKKVEAKKPAVILLNFMMPGIDGLEVCQILRKKTETKDIPIIFTSGCPKDELEFLESCGADFVQLPFITNKLVTCIKRNLH